jgi:hypothetical protein
VIAAMVIGDKEATESPVAGGVVADVDVINDTAIAAFALV